MSNLILNFASNRAANLTILKGVSVYLSIDYIETDSLHINSLPET